MTDFEHLSPFANLRMFIGNICIAIPGEPEIDGNIVLKIALPNLIIDIKGQHGLERSPRIVGEIDVNGKEGSRWCKAGWLLKGKSRSTAVWQQPYPFIYIGCSLLQPPPRSFGGCKDRNTKPIKMTVRLQSHRHWSSVEGAQSLIRGS